MHQTVKLTHIARRMEFSIKDFFSKCDQIHRKPRIWSHLLKKPLMEIFIFCAVAFNGYEFPRHKNKKKERSIIDVLMIITIQHDTEGVENAIIF